jgi:hypothetical protein
MGLPFASAIQVDALSSCGRMLIRPLCPKRPHQLMSASSTASRRRTAERVVSSSPTRSIQKNFFAGTRLWISPNSLTDATPSASAISIVIGIPLAPGTTGAKLVDGRVGGQECGRD